MSPGSVSGAAKQRQDDPEGRDEQLRGPWWYSHRRSVTEEQRRDVYSQLFYEGPDLVPFLSRFALLMGMAVLIALFGLARDSGPVVIGAMLISPLTTPILGLATSLVLGHPRRQLKAALILAGATVGGIALAVVVAWLLPDPKFTTLSSQQLLDRTEPDILDLAVAVVAGAAAAYILVRREAVSALPGVAIAVALVPPLTAVGMTLELGKPELAGDALLLYLTNLAGIILSASLVMLLMGVGAKPDSEGALPRRIKVGLSTAAVAAFLVAVPLLEHTRRSFHDSKDLYDAEQRAAAWIAGTDLTLGEVDLEDTDEITIEVLGPKPPPDASDLARQIAQDLEEEVTVRLIYRPAESTTVTASP
jgi:uncharacterized hydrophobic protein (TIGR00271 family)